MRGKAGGDSGPSRNPRRGGPGTPPGQKPRAFPSAQDHRRRRQELANSLTHGVAALASIAALGPLIILAAVKGNARHVVSFSVFGSALVFLFTASTLMHVSRWDGTKRRILEFLDHAGIYLVIAATYTPFCLVTLRGALGWSLFGVVWGLAAVGMLLSLAFGERFTRYADGIYLLMGWLIVVAIRPLASALTLPGLALVLGGGLAYSTGVVFLTLKRSLHFHAIWHLFVGLGALLHLAAMVFYVLPDMR
jgi:hemolysin III